MFPTLAAGQLDQPLPAPAGADRAARPAPKLTKPPTIKKQVEPVYPPEALDGGVAGDVTLTIDIAADGHVTAVSVATPAGHGFDEAAVAAAREMEFFPAEVDGKPSPIRIEYTIHFQPQTVVRPKLRRRRAVRCRRRRTPAPPDAAPSAARGCPGARTRRRARPDPRARHARAPRRRRRRR